MPCTQEMFEAALDDPRVADICKQIASLDPHEPGFEDKKGNLKRQLPIAIFHASAFSGNRRISSEATPSGLIMIDVDHLDDPRAKWQEVVNKFPRLEGGEGAASAAGEEPSIHFAAITPSKHGLRLVGERNIGESIEDAQMRLAAVCGFEQVDTVTKDLARASYMMPRAYVLYYDPQFLFSFPSQEAETFWKNCTPQDFQTNPTVDPQEDCKPTECSTTFQNVPYAAIIEQLLILMGNEGGAMIGERNTVFFSLATYLRYICDFNADQLLAVLPDYGLSVQERKQAIHSAIGRPRKNTMPLILQSAFALAKNQIEQDRKDEMTEGVDELPLPKLPRLLQLICRRLPEAYRPAMVIAALPVLGTLATRIRFNYLDGQQHSLSFFACISAPCASGKSFIRRPIDLLLTPINEVDAVEMQKQQEYMEKLRVSKNTKSQPEDPHACPRNNGVNISIARLLQLLTYSEGKHLIGICEEMDTLAKSEKAGVWSQKNDIYRLSFDNSEYGQSYFSTNSFSAKVKVYYNLLLTGTPKSMMRFFKGDNVENGLMTRTCFAQLPDTSYTQMPVFEPYTDKEKEEIIGWARQLDKADGEIRCVAVEKAIAEWLEDKRQKALDADSHAADTIRRRAAVIGYRAGMLCYLLEGKCTKSTVAAFATWVAEYVFKNQMEMFGDKLEQEITSGLETVTTGGAASALIDLLPHSFETKDLIAVRVKKGQSTKPNAICMLLRRWQDSGKIIKVSDKKYKKI